MLRKMHHVFLCLKVSGPHSEGLHTGVSGEPHERLSIFLAGVSKSAELMLFKLFAPEIAQILPVIKLALQIGSAVKSRLYVAPQLFIDHVYRIAVNDRLKACLLKLLYSLPHESFKAHRHIAYDRGLFADILSGKLKALYITIGVRPCHPYYGFFRKTGHEPCRHELLSGDPLPVAVQV